MLTPILLLHVTLQEPQQHSLNHGRLNVLSYSELCQFRIKNLTEM